MKKAIPFLAVFFCGCTMLAGSMGIVPLSSDEAKVAQSIALARQELIVKRNETAAKFQADMNRLNEGENDLNIQAQKLCFQVKKSHKLDPTVTYRLNEWKGQLEK